MAVVRAQGVTARAPRGADRAWLRAWLPEALAGAAAAGADAPPVRLVVVERDGKRAGAAGWRPVAGDTRAALIAFVATAPGQARRGTGMAAVPLLEARLRRAGARIAYAPATAAHGISVYFWVRLGYRPVSRPAWPCDVPGVAWFVRDLSPASSE